MGLVEVSLSCSCIALSNILFWCSKWFIPLTDKSDMGSGVLKRSYNRYVVIHCTSRLLSCTSGKPDFTPHI